MSPVHQPAIGSPDACSPELLLEWHSDENGALTARDLLAGSGKKVWWKCPSGPDHFWQAPIVHRTTRKAGCPFCAGRLVSVTNCLATQGPDVAAQWHAARNGTLTPYDVVSGSNRKVWWRCSKGLDHEWQTRIVHRTTDKTGCPFCSGQRVSVTNSLANQIPDVAAQWHPTRNGALNPDQVAARSGKKAWWTCPGQPDHDWQARIADRTSGRKSGCPFCATRRA